MSNDRFIGEVRNGSELGKVPMSSKPATSPGGRPPVMTDEQLLRLAEQLNAKFGRPPRAEELIDAAGGCQRKRALAALRVLKLELARRSVQSGLIFPSAIEQAIRSQMADWLTLAAGSLAATHLEESDRTEAKVSTQAALIEELQVRTQTLKEQIADRDRMVADLVRRVELAETSESRAKAAAIQAKAVADERARILARLEAHLRSA